MYYTVIKHSKHLGILEKCRKHELQSVFDISQVFSNAWSVLSQCNISVSYTHLTLPTKLEV